MGGKEGHLGLRESSEVTGLITEMSGGKVSACKVFTKVYR